MTTNQTIDGVPRELLENIALNLSDDPAFYVDPMMADHALKLRALLDAPAQPSSDPAGSFDKHMQYMRENIELKKRIAPLLAAQHQGEPVALPELKDGNGPSLSNHRSYNQGWNAYAEAVRKLGPLYAEQPAPVYEPVGTDRVSLKGAVFHGDGKHQAFIHTSNGMIANLDGCYILAPGVEPTAWVQQCKMSGLIEQADPNDKASDPSGWTDAFPVYRLTYSNEKQQTPIGHVHDGILSSPVNYGALDPVQRLAVCRGEEVAVVLPERKRADHCDESQDVKSYFEELGWNACLDEVTRLNTKE